ncbi:MAG: glycosyltransferase family 4 protein [Acidobacteria bacterium]|nr:glycosyltransferase family 4 protein [Acidobacteriota bacterium]
MTDHAGRGGDRRLRVLEIETFGRGGLIHYAFNLARALAARGHGVTLLTAAAYELDDRPLPEGVALVKAIGGFTHRFGHALPSPLASMARKLEALADACAVAVRARRLRPDVVHLHCTNQVALAYITLLRLFRLPLVVTAHVVTPHEPTARLVAVHRRIHRASPTIVAHSAFDRKRLVDEAGVEEARVVVIPHGEYGFFEEPGAEVDRDDARRLIGLSPEDEAVLFFGYIREYKGLDILLEAWPAVAAARRRARLVIAGDPVQLPPSRRAELEAAASRVGALHRFEYVPFGEVTRYCAAADLLVLPYRRVSQSGVLYLALARGLPVVATRVGALAEVLRDGESALLVEPESPDALASALRRALTDAGLRRRLAEGGRAVAAEHSWPSIARLTERVFEQVATAAQPPR